MNKKEATHTFRRGPGLLGKGQGRFTPLKLSEGVAISLLADSHTARHQYSSVNWSRM